MTDSTFFQSSSLSCANGVSSRTAALLTSRSSRPKRPTAAATMADTARGSATSAMCTSPSPPADLIDARVSSASAREERALTTTAAPAAASASEIARPMLRAPPVTRTTLPDSSRVTVMVLSYRTHPRDGETDARDRKQGQGVLAARLHQLPEDQGIPHQERRRLRVDQRARQRGRHGGAAQARREKRADRRARRQVRVRADADRRHQVPRPEDQAAGAALARAAHGEAGPRARLGGALHPPDSRGRDGEALPQPQSPQAGALAPHLPHRRR